MSQKVLFLITKSNWGGAQRYVFDLATNLPAEYEPIVALGGDGPLIEKLKAAGIRVIPIPGLQRDISFKKELLSFWQIMKLVRSERPDVLHVNSSKAGGIGALIGRCLRVPRIIYTAHGWAFNEDRTPLSRFIVGFFHWLTILLSHQTITVSQALKAQMHWPLTARKMTTIPLGRPAIIFKSKEDARGVLEMRVTDRAHGLTEFHHDLWVGTIAELHPIKRHNVAIDAIAIAVHAFPRLRYVIIGDGERRAALEAQVEKLGLQANVFFLGHVDEAARFLKAFDIFVLASHSEAGAYVITEAGLAHLPVVATRVGGIPELVTNGESGFLVAPDDADALAQALVTLASDKHLRTDFAETLGTLAATRTIDHMVARTTALYDATTSYHSTLPR